MTKLRFLKYILIVTLSVALCDFIISFIIESRMKERYNNIIYSSLTTSSDIAILGASRAAHHYVPNVFKDSLQMTAINYGIDGQNMFTHYVILNNLLGKKQKPKMVVLEISAIDINDTPRWNTEKLNILYPYYNSNVCVRDLLSNVLDPKERIVLKFSGIYRHNSNYITYLYRMVAGFPKASDGYRPLTKQWTKPIEFEEEHGSSYHPKKVEYLEKISALCKKDNIKLVITVSPNYKILPDQKWVKKVKEIAEKEDIPFLYHEKDTLYQSHKEWFNEPFHLNDEGANIYTKQICGEIKSMF